MSSCNEKHKMKGPQKQVKSKTRVADHGEVFTNPREVNAMLDLVKDQTERIEATFLEPACGTGNFLIEILRRKLKVLLSKYGKSKLEYDANLIKAVSSIYGVELLEDNVLECRTRLFTEVKDSYPKKFIEEDYSALLDSVQFILDTNIICGDALNYTTSEGKPIMFVEWKFINDTDVKRRYFDYQVVLDKSKQLSLFGDDGKPAHIAEHGKEHPPIHYLKLGKDENA